MSVCWMVGWFVRSFVTLAVIFRIQVRFYEFGTDVEHSKTVINF